MNGDLLYRITKNSVSPFSYVTLSKQKTVRARKLAEGKETPPFHCTTGKAKLCANKEAHIKS